MAENRKSSAIDLLNFISQLISGNYSQKLAPSDDPALAPLIEKLNELSSVLAAQAADLNQTAKDALFIIDSLGIGVWKWDLTTNALEWDKNMYKLYGADPSEFSGAYEAWENSLSAETKTRAVEEINSALAGNSNFDTTFQVVHRKTGKVQEIRTRAFIIRGESGQPLKMWGINIDRSKEAELESAVRKTLRTLEATSKFLEHTGEMAKVGGWELDISTLKVFMTRQTQILHEIDENYEPPVYTTGSEWYPPEAWPTVKAAVDAAILEGKPYDLESPFITAKGRRIWVRVQGFPVKSEGKVTHLRGTFQDITERKNAEIERQKTSESLAIYKAVLDNSSDFIGIANTEMVPTYCNPAGRTMLGIPLDKNISELAIQECYPEDIRDGVLGDIMKAMSTHGIWQGETFFQHFETKELIPVHDVHFLVKDPKTGSPIGLATITRNISKERSLQMHAVQQSKLASLGEMSAGIAHEINNPLAVIIGSASLLKKYTNDPVKFDSKVETILKSAARIEKIVKGLKKFSRSSSEETVRTVSSIETIIFDSLTLTEAKAKQHSTPITYQIAPNLSILCDPLEIEQVLVNLINNGIDAVKGQAAPWIKINAFSQDSEVVIQVVDSGHGISPEKEKKMFLPFFTTKTVGEGTGLGLSIAKGILDAHNSSIAVNRSFSTTCFEIRFPRGLVTKSETKNAA